MQEQEYLMISTSTEMVRLREECVVCITSDGNYSHICAIRGRSFFVASHLGQIEQIIAAQLHSSYKENKGCDRSKIAAAFNASTKGNQQWVTSQIRKERYEYSSNFKN